MITKPFTIDKTKIKRIFAYGCSYTSYFWPTWANLIANEIPNAEFYNFGRIGSGNLAISCRVAETNARFNFNENDLVMIMWSSYTRNDHWVSNDGWFGAGSVYGTDFYSYEYRVKYANSLAGFLVRDFALINATITNLNYLPCQAILMASTPNNFYDKISVEDGEVAIVDKLHDLYDPMFNQMPMTLLKYFNQHNLDDVNNWAFPVSHSYSYDGITKNSLKLYDDTHPSPVRYFNYLNDNIMSLSPATETYANRCNSELLTLKSMREIENHFNTNNIKETVLF